MLRFASIVLGSLLVVWQLGCGGASRTAEGKDPTPQANISIFPTSVSIGSPDLTLTVSGSQQFSFTSDPSKLNVVVWSVGDSDTQLTTTFVNSLKLNAVVPASLLTTPNGAKVHVEIWDFKEEFPQKSSSVTFDVVVAAPSISSISPTSVPAGSSDVTLTINGENYYEFFLNQSIAFWTTCDNLHDCGTMLDTRMVNNGELKAVIPAALLQNPSSVQIVVLTGDSMGMSDGFFGYPRSNSVTFTVTP